MRKNQRAFTEFTQTISHLHELLALWAIGLFALPLANAAILSVGPSGMFATPCAAVAAAAAGDTINVDPAGTYVDDFCAIQEPLTIRSSGPGRARIISSGTKTLAWGQAIYVLTAAPMVIEGLEFSGAKTFDGSNNGAGVRLPSAPPISGGVTIRNCSFHDNEEGMLAGDNSNLELTIEYSEFYQNGHSSGFSHNLYINKIKKLVFQFNYSARSRVGHLVKSRAFENHVLYNRLSQESGDGSYELDLSNGGDSWVTGNIIQQGNSSQNMALVSFAAEGLHPNSMLRLYHNTFVNQRAAGSYLACGPRCSSIAVTASNNIFYGGASFPAGVSGLPGAGAFTGDPMFVNVAALDVHLTTGSGAIDNGVVIPGVSVNFEYKHPASAVVRTQSGIGPDVGAYEFPQPPPPVTWKVAEGTLPPGLSLDGLTGLITGTPTASGVYDLAVTATPSAPGLRTITKHFTIPVWKTIQYFPFIPSPSTLATGIVNRTYSYKLEVLVQ